MAIQNTFTNPDTGTVIANAYYLVYPPIMRRETRQMTLRVEVYASKADADAGKAPEWTYTRQFSSTQFNPLWAAMLNLIEPALISMFFPTGVRVAD